MLIKRIVWTLLITGVIVASATVSQAQSTGRRPWPRGVSVNPTLTMPDQTAQSAAVLETQLAVKRSKKTAIVGSWLGTSSEGNGVVISFTSDGIAIVSVQGGVSTIPGFGVLTPGHGVWEHLGGRQFGVTVRSINYDINTGEYLGMLRARLLLTLNEAGDQLSGADKVEIFGPGGELVFAVTGDTTYTQIKFEPFN